MRHTHANFAGDITSTQTTPPQSRPPLSKSVEGRGTLLVRQLTKKGTRRPPRAVHTYVRRDKQQKNHDGRLGCDSPSQKRRSVRQTLLRRAIPGPPPRQQRTSSSFFWGLGVGCDGSSCVQRGRVPHPAPNRFIHGTKEHIYPPLRPLAPQVVSFTHQYICYCCATAG